MCFTFSATVPFLQQGGLPKLPVLRHMLQGNWSLTGSVRGGRSNLLCLFRAGSKNREWGGDKMEMRWEGRREMQSWIQKLEKMGKLEKDKDTCLE